MSRLTSAKGPERLPRRPVVPSSAQDELVRPQRALREALAPAHGSPSLRHVLPAHLARATVAVPSQLVRDGHQPVQMCPTAPRPPPGELQVSGRDPSGGVGNGWPGDPGWRWRFSPAPSPPLSCRGQTAVVTLLSAPPTKPPPRDREGGTLFFLASGGVAAVVVAKEGQGAQAHDTRPPWPGWDGRAGPPAPLCQLSALSSALDLVSARLLGVPLLPRPRAREPPRTTVLSTHTAARAPSHMLKAQGPAQEGPHGPKIGSVGLHPCRCTVRARGRDEGPGRQ